MGLLPKVALGIPRHQGFATESWMRSIEPLTNRQLRKAALAQAHLDDNERVEALRAREMLGKTMSQTEVQKAQGLVPDWLPMHYVSWLPLVYEVAARFRAGKPGRRNIYLVRLDYRDRGAALQGIYVGMTAYAPALRFDQHRGGIRAAGSVLKRGQELLIGPVLHLQHIAQADAVRIERDLAIALADAGLLVEGGH
jgi:hypothetical protein